MDVLQLQSLPLRNYLMKHVIPTLTAGLIEVAKSRPDDPIDFLAEYMFKVVSFFTVAKSWKLNLEGTLINYY